jgi:hypothetical protein
MATQDVVLQFSSEREDFKGTLRSFMSPPDQIAFERIFDIGLGRFEEERRITWVLWFIWRAWTREQRGGIDFDTFVDELADYDFADELEGDETTAGEVELEGKARTAP